MAHLYIQFWLFLGAPVLKPQRTATTLCVPDPTFHDVTGHRIVLPHGVPAQRELLTGQLSYFYQLLL